MTAIATPQALVLGLPEALFVPGGESLVRPGLLRALLDIHRLQPGLPMVLAGQVSDSQNYYIDSLKGLLAAEGIRFVEAAAADLPLQGEGCVAVGNPAQLAQAFPAAQCYDLDAETGLTWAEVPARLLPPRIGAVHRKTHETDIDLMLNLDGSGKSDIQTSLGFFDHMLDQIARHAGCDLHLRCQGDLHVDEHHTVEDVGLALGEAFTQALGDKRGLTRYGFILPMDEAQARVALDFSGRAYLVWQANLRRERVGELPTELVPHFFKSLCDTARLTLHITVEGDNDHHQIEAAFKGFARALRAALRRDPFSAAIPSTKGLL